MAKLCVIQCRDIQMLTSSLPGLTEPFFLKAGTGERYVFGSQLATVIARNKDTGGLFEGVIYSGGKSTSLPLHRHAGAHEAVLALAGQVALHLHGRDFILARGDYASIPPGVLHGHRFLSHHTELLSWTVGGSVTPMFPVLGVSYPGHVHPPPQDLVVESGKLSRASAVADVSFDLGVNWEHDAQEPCSYGSLPDGFVPYTRQAGEGDCRIAGSTIFNMLTRQRNSAGKFIAVMAEGPARPRVPFHYHERHTENFFCVDGAMTMWANHEKVILGPGDYLHVPANTIHSYQQDSHYTRFFGILCPGLFEIFFDTFAEPYNQHIFPLQPAPFRYDRVVESIELLDVKQVESFEGAGERMSSSAQ
jgi:quercetin 2,3-dioxygenase